MLAKVYSCAVVGLDGVLGEVDVGGGTPGMGLVGLPDAAVRESQERVRAAIRNSGGRFPHGKVTVNLALADLKKAGPTYDLPIALAVLVAGRQVPAGAALEDALIVGELLMDGVEMMKPAMRQLYLSARAYHRVLKLARTIADLAGVIRSASAHVAEALRYRPRQAMA